MDTKNYLVTADLSYKQLKAGSFIPSSDGVQYEVVEALHTKSGYDGYILYRKDTNELIVAHRGTWSEKGALTTDVLSDLGMVANQVNDQYPDAKRLTEIAIKRSQSKKYQGAVIYQTGHSLGGALAQLCAYNYGQHAETFNAYGAANLKGKEHGKQNNVSLITNHVRGTDPVSAAAPHLGRVEYYLNSDERKLLHDGGYGAADPNHPLWTAVKGAVKDHGLDNFKNGGFSDRDKQFAAQNKVLINEFRSEFQRTAQAVGGGVRYAQEKVNEANKTIQDLKNKATEKGKSILDTISGEGSSAKRFHKTSILGNLPPKVQKIYKEIEKSFNQYYSENHRSMPDSEQRNNIVAAVTAAAVAKKMDGVDKFDIYNGNMVVFHESRTGYQHAVVEANKASIIPQEESLQAIRHTETVFASEKQRQQEMLMQQSHGARV